ncbi:MAG: DUF1559 domain-containing protein [Pirellulales bacterium]
MAVALDLKPIREMVAFEMKGRKPSPQLGVLYAMASPIWEQADRAYLTIDAADGLKLKLIAEVPDDAAAKAVEDSFRALVTTAKGTIPAIRGGSGALDAVRPGLGGKLCTHLETSLTDCSIGRFEKTVTLRLNFTQDALADGVTALLPSIRETQSAGRDAQALNNLKAIGLAMHNFAMANGALPPAAKPSFNGKHALSCAWRSCRTWIKTPCSSNTNWTSRGIARPTRRFWRKCRRCIVAGRRSALNQHVLRGAAVGGRNLHDDAGAKRDVFGRCQRRDQQHDHGDRDGDQYPLDEARRFIDRPDATVADSGVRRQRDVEHRLRRRQRRNGSPRTRRSKRCCRSSRPPKRNRSIAKH